MKLVVPLRHWTEEELLAALYGGGLDDGHLSRCAACRRRLGRLYRRRGRTLEAESLRGLRLRVESAIEPPLDSMSSGSLLRAAFIVGVLVVGALVSQLVQQGGLPASLAEQVSASAGDLSFEEILSYADAAEPEAVAPLRGLFEEHPL